MNRPKHGEECQVFHCISRLHWVCLRGLNDEPLKVIVIPERCQLPLCEGAHWREMRTDNQRGPPLLSGMHAWLRVRESLPGR